MIHLVPPYEVNLNIQLSTCVCETQMTPEYMQSAVDNHISRDDIFKLSHSQGM